jgi:hypothetical protein
VQPGGNGRFATELAGTLERRDERLLQRIGCILRIARRTQRDSPQAVAVSLDNEGKGPGITPNVQ